MQAMSQALYEQYKEALRRGHVAALRGRLDVAESAYRTAAAIAPDRALPWTSLGGVLGRLGRPEEALAAFGTALQRSAEDEGALRGRAELHADQGRRTDAAEDFEALAGVLERGGRLTDACDAARRALELAESRSRRREVERLAGLLRESGEDRPVVDALDQALKVLEAVETRGPETAGSATEAGERQPESSSERVPEPEPEAEAAPEPARAAPQPDPAVLRAVADALLDDGDIAGASERLLGLATLHRAAGRLDAAMDACLALLAVTPSDHRLQREIAAIQVDRGWTSTANDKVRLLARLAELDGDADAEAALIAFAAERGLDEPVWSRPGA
jgi:tetratricopeptide (TPR) repeat protein